jgi:hypothetical protein
MDDRLSQSVVYYSVRTMHFHSTTAPMAWGGGSKGFLVALELPAQGRPYGEREIRDAGPAASERVPPRYRR